MTAAVLVRQRYACAYESGPRPIVPFLPAQASTWRLAGPVARLAHPATAYCSAVTTEAVVALTYDDGPDPHHTPGVLDVLRDTNTRATFFVLVEQAEAHRDLIARILDEGHEIGLHGLDHARISAEGLAGSIRRVTIARRRLAELTGQPVRWYRPAYGAIRLTQQLAVHALGLDVPVWTAWARDWEDEDVAVLADRAARALHPGGVLLLHDAASGLGVDAADAARPPRFDRADLTRRLLAAADADGYRFTTLGRLATAYEQARVPWFETRAMARAASAS